MLVRTRPVHPAFDRSFDRVFDQLTRSFPVQARRSPVVDATWQDGAFVLTVDLPGTPADQVDVAVSGRTLTLSVGDGETSWERRVRLGAMLDADQVSATYLDGRLTVTVAASTPVEARRIEVSTTPAAVVTTESTDVAESSDEDQPENGTSDNA